MSEPTAGGALHWAPHHDPGYGARMQALARWVAGAQPEACVVDVSVEVALFLRLLGVPVIVFALPGERTDSAHVLVHRVADHILAAWPAALNSPHWLLPHAGKTTYVGGISRFEGRPRSTGPHDDPGTSKVLLLGGAGGGFGDHTPELAGVTWRVIGGDTGAWVADPWTEICAADVVVSHAGQNSIADLAAAGRPAVIIPQPRPFGEQQATAEVLSRHGLALAEAQWPSRDHWPHLLRRARSIDTRRWRRWQVRGAAARAADAIEATATRCRAAAS
ncbi:glycosyltransferase [Mycolicibacterium sp. BiH015]|uniref:glycosyltransferase n=1 Tax=Mycolicibacterium sp. BiH015 TaxID=3018808 RepID=UPI0022E50435|nr:glycosyltransferase [Mycolicibacterium sp. BiH015]MDA2891179.1 glycosyltransferase [Mycolicibacterium sp. BiH015]